MARLRFSFLWRVTTAVLLAAPLLNLTSSAARVFTSFKLNALCRFCDDVSSTCQNTGTCESTCNMTMICEHQDEICAGVWRKEGGNVTVELLCHNPALPLYGVMLNDTSAHCVMKQYRQLGPDVYMCSCNEWECNELLIFPEPEPEPEPEHEPEREHEPEAEPEAEAEAKTEREGAARVFTSFKLNALCRFCDDVSSTCQNTGTCESTCNMTMICEHQDEICAGVWRKEGGNVTVELLCHNPALPLYGVMLNDTSAHCVMKQYRQLGPDVYMCSCNEWECNELLIFPEPEPEPEPEHEPEREHEPEAEPEAEAEAKSERER